MQPHCVVLQLLLYPFFVLLRSFCYSGTSAIPDARQLNEVAVPFEYFSLWGACRDLESSRTESFTFDEEKKSEIRDAIKRL